MPPKAGPSSVVVVTLAKRRPAVSGGGGGSDGGPSRNTGGSSSRASSSSPGGGGGGGVKRKRHANNDKKERKSARYRAVIDDKDFEASVQSSYSITPAASESTRTLPLGLQAQRDGSNFVFFSLAAICLEIAARNFGTHVLPTQDTFAAAQARVDGRGIQKGPPRREVAREKAAQKAAQKKRNQAVAARMGRQMGLPGRIVPDSDEEDEEADYQPSDEEVRRDASNRRVSSRRKTTPDATSASVRRQPSLSTPTTRHRDLHPDELHFLTARNHQILKILPPHHVSKLQSLVLLHSPTSLTQRVLTTYFIASRPSVDLSSDLALLTVQPTAAAALLQSADPSHLRTLSLNGLTRLQDRALCSLFAKCKHLSSVTLRGCVGIGARSATALVASCGSTLRELDAESTDFGADGVSEVVKHAPFLEVLNVASVQGLDDTSVPALLDAAIEHQLHTAPPTIPLAHLRTLKVRSTNVGDISVSLLIKMCARTLERLDVGFTHVGSGGNLDMLGMALGIQSMLRADEEEVGDDDKKSGSDAPHAHAPQAYLRELVLSGLTLHASNLCAFVEALCDPQSSRLDTLHLAKVHARVDTITSRRQHDVPHAPLGPGVIGRVCTAIQQLALRRESDSLGFRELVLAGNEGLVTITGGASFMGDYGGPEECALADLHEWPPNLRLGVVLYHMGQICETLDLSEIASPSTGGAPRLNAAVVGAPPTMRTRHLQLSDTRIADDVLFALATYTGQVRTLSLANCQVTPASLDAFVHANPFLDSLDVTGCRGVPVAKRRNYLALFDEERAGSNVEGD